MSGFNLPGGPLPSGPWHTQIPAPTRPVVGPQYNGAAPNLPAGWGDFTGAQVARPSAEQLAGGHMVLPPRPPMWPDPSGAGPFVPLTQTGAGAPPAAGATPTGYGNPQSGGGQFGAGGQYVYDNPADYVKSFMLQHGADYYKHTPVGDSMYKLLARALPAIFDLTTGGGTLAMDKLNDPSGMLNSIFFGGPGSAFGKMADFGRQGFDALKGQMGDLPVDVQAQLISARSGLETAGMNPFMQAAQENRLARQLGGYKEFEMQNRANPAVAGATSLWDYLINAGLNPFAYGGK
jgi:hypothetical protein